MTLANRRYAIYLLSCPISNEPKYIGATSDIDKRYKQHCRLSENLKNTPRCNWLRKLLEQGLKPTITILEEGLDCYDVAEKKWIKEYSLRHKLVNGNAGGFDLSHTHRSPKSNAARGKRSKVAIFLSRLKTHVNTLKKKGDLETAERLEKKYLHLMEICWLKRKEGTYDLFVQLCEERLPG